MFATLSVIFRLLGHNFGHPSTSQAREMQISQASTVGNVAPWWLGGCCCPHILLHPSPLQWQLPNPCGDADTSCCQIFGKVIPTQPYTAYSSLFPIFLAWWCLIMQHYLCNSPCATKQPCSAQIPNSAQFWLRMGILPLSGNGHRATPCSSPFSGQL